MKKALIIFIIAFLGVCNLGLSQAPDWLWAKSAGGGSWDAGTSITTDSNGNVFMTGYFLSESVQFGPITLLMGDTFYFSIFIVKYDVNGNVLWVERGIGNGHNNSTSISTDAYGNVYLAGSFLSPTITFGTITLTNVGEYDTFIVKYDTFGNVLWARSGGGIGRDLCTSVSTDINGDIYMSGVFYSSILEIGTTALINNSNPSNGDIFIAKFDSSGDFIWAKSAGGTDNDYINSISIDTNNNVFVTGSYNSPSFTFGTIPFFNEGAYDIFIAKLDSGGNILWGKSIGSTLDDYGYSLSAKHGDDVVITGSFQGPTINFGSNSLINNGISNILIAKYDETGNILWAKSAVTSYFGEGRCVDIDKSGNIILSGTFGSPSIIFATISLSNVHGSFDDIFITKYNSNGFVLNALSTGGHSFDDVNGLSIDKSGDIYITGVFKNYDIPFGSTLLINQGSSDIYIAKLKGTSLESPVSLAFSVSPNPFTTETTLSFNKEQKNTSIKISNIIGQEIESILFTGHQYTLVKGTMSPGVYLIQTMDENKNVSNKKIIVQ